ATASYDPPGTFSNACHVAMVALDTGTGATRLRRYLVVEDCGVVINPLVVEGQVRGGVAHLETPSRHSETGAKGMGEGGLIGAPAAVLNAINDALSGTSIRFDHIPVLPQDLLAMLAGDTPCTP